MAKMNPNAQGKPEEETPTEDGETPEADEAEAEDTTDEETSEESDGVDEGEESDEADGEAEQKPGKNLFFDPNKLPEELKAPFKKMQAAFTKKMQDLSGVRRQAEAFQELTAMPQFKEFIKKLREGGDSGEETPEENPTREGDKGKQASIEQLVERAVNKAFAPHLQASKQARTKEALETELAQFKTDHPEWENYQEPMHELLTKNPAYTFEDAFKLAAFDDLVENEGKVAEEVVGRKKKGNINRGGGPNIGNRKVAPSKAKSILEAFEQAERQHGVKKGK